MYAKDIAINPNPPPKKIPLLFSEIAALNTNTAPANPTNNTKTPVRTGSKLAPVING